MRLHVAEEGNFDSHRAVTPDEFGVEARLAARASGREIVGVVSESLDDLDRCEVARAFGADGCWCVLTVSVWAAVQRANEFKSQGEDLHHRHRLPLRHAETLLHHRPLRRRHSHGHTHILVS